MKRYLPLIITLIILAITTWVRFAAVANYNFAITYDQGRDLMEIRSIVVGLRPTLVGPTTSINGAFLGPFYYYFNVIPFWLGQGDPAWIMGWQILWYQLTGVLIFIFFYQRKQKIFATIFAYLYLLMPIGFYINRFFWNIDPMTMNTVWMLLAMIWTTEKPTKIKLFSLGLLTGISLQIEAAFGILLLPLALFYLNFTKILNLYKFIIYFSGFILTTIPQIIYELLHNFTITKTLFLQFTGQSNILSQSLPFTERLTDRYHHYMRIIIDTSHLPPWLAIGFFIIALIFTIIITLKKHKHINAYTLLPLSLLILSLFLYFIFPQPLKSWYIDALSIPIIFIEALFLTYVYKLNTINRNHSKNSSKLQNSPYIIYKLTIVVFLILILYATINEQIKYIQTSNRLHHKDPSNLANQIQIVDWIYQQANNQSFQVYSYLPSVYDHAYQHIFWWHGTKTYGYQPSKITYANDVPPYVKSETKLWTKTKPLTPASPTFLIIEPDPENPHRREQWLSNFTHLCLQTSIQFSWQTTVQLRTPCN